MKKGFTLLEILLVIAAIGILAAIVIVAINPTRQLSQVRNAQRYSDTNSLVKAFDQYLIDSNAYPLGLTNSYQEICAQDAIDCTGYYDAQSTLVPQYLAAIPSDAQATGNGSGYEVGINSENNKISVRSILSELAVEISINPIDLTVPPVEFALFGNGFNSLGRIGDGTTTQRLTPVAVGVDTDWVHIASGMAATSHAIKSDGTYWAWGNNGDGNFGNGGTTSSNIPIQIGSNTNWEFIDGGSEFTVGLRSDGTIWSWGLNTYGQLGDGSTTQRLSPIQIGSDTDWAQIEAGANHVLALKDNGTIWAWGRNNLGHLGDGSTTQRLVPVQIGSDTDWASIHAGYWDNFAIKDNGTLWSWGRNDQGQVGDGSTTPRLSPVQVGSDTNWEEIEGGVSHALALKSNGQIWAWGNGTNGQVGDGTYTDRLTPVQVGTDSDWITISTPGNYNQAIKSDGTLWRWGNGFNGELGNGTSFTDSNIPLQIGTDTDWVSLGGGIIHAFASK